MTEQVRSQYRAALILLGFPFLILTIFPMSSGVRLYFSGDEAYWFTYWGLVALLEWGTLAFILASYKHPIHDVQKIIFPTPVKPKEVFVFSLLVIVFCLLAIFGSVVSQEFLSRVPPDVQALLPPNELGYRLFWVFMALTAAIVEETLWRGIAVAELTKLFKSPKIAIVVSAVSFAFYHGGTNQTFMLFLSRFSIAVFFSYLYSRTGSLKWPIIIHFFVDAILLLLVG